MQLSCSHYNVFCSTTCTSMQPLQCDLHPDVAEHSRGTDYASIWPPPAAATTHRKIQSFVLQFPPHSKPHAIFMQRLHCVLQHRAHIDAAITMRFASTRCRTHQNTMEEPMTRRNERTRSCRAHELPFIACHFTRKNTMFSAPASSPKHSPCNSRAAITVRLALFCTVWLCDVLLCDVLLCDVLLCDVLFCDVLLCDVLFCDVLLCDVLLCDVLFCDVLLCDVLFCDVLLSDVMYCYVIIVM